MLHSANLPSIPAVNLIWCGWKTEQKQISGEKPEERDEDFAGFIKETLGEDLYSSIQMNGEGFDQEWAQKIRRNSSVIRDARCFLGIIFLQQEPAVQVQSRYVLPQAERIPLYEQFAWYLRM